jgi:hypothetical protein
MGRDGAVGENHEPDVEQLTVWRNLLDALGQLSSAWDAAEDLADALESEAVGLPDEMVIALACAGVHGAEALHGVARVLASGPRPHKFAAVADSQRRAQQQWAEVYRGISTSSVAERMEDRDRPDERA